MTTGRCCTARVCGNVRLGIFLPTSLPLLLNGAAFHGRRGGPLALSRPMLLEPAWQGVADPIDIIFALLAYYRQALVATDCTYGCPIGSLALELHEPDPAVRKLLAANFSAWTGAIAECLKDAGPRLPRGTKVRELASFILTTMEGGVMQARTHRSMVTYDAAVNQLRGYLSYLEAAASANPRKAS